MGIEIPPEFAEPPYNDANGETPARSIRRLNPAGDAVARLSLDYLRRWPFVWHFVPDRSDHDNFVAAVDRAGLRDGDLRQPVLDALVTWFPLEEGSPGDIEAENVVINVLDAAVDEQDRRRA